jgi:hypothetical protein
VGPAVVGEGVARGWDVTTVNRSSGGCRGGWGGRPGAARSSRPGRANWRSSTSTRGTWPGFALDAGTAGSSGAFNTVAPRGFTTMGELLDACCAVAGAGDAALRWVDAETVLAAGIEPWMDLPVWIPPGHEYEGMHGADVSRALAAGLHCRTLHETVADTWAWLSALAAPPPLRTDLPPLGLEPERERAVLAGLLAGLCGTG